MPYLTLVSLVHNIVPKIVSTLSCSSCPEKPELIYIDTVHTSVSRPGADYGCSEERRLVRIGLW